MRKLSNISVLHYQAMILCACSELCRKICVRSEDSSERSKFRRRSDSLTQAVNCRLQIRRISNITETYSSTDWDPLHIVSNTEPISKSMPHLIHMPQDQTRREASDCQNPTRTIPLVSSNMQLKFYKGWGELKVRWCASWTIQGLLEERSWMSRSILSIL